MNSAEITIHGPTPNGRYNLIGIEAGGFCLQGGLTRDQMVQLREAIDAKLAERNA